MAGKGSHDLFNEFLNVVDLRVTADLALPDAAAARAAVRWVYFALNKI
jgi:hypothetical protein